MNPFTPTSRHARRVASCSLVAFAAASLSAADTPATTATLTALTYSGDQQSLATLDRELGAAGTDAAKLAALESRLVAVLRSSDSSFAARQAIAQRLGRVLGLGSGGAMTESARLFAALLVDERDCDLARLALEPVPGEAVDTLFVTALGKATGRVRLGLLDSIARRRPPAAVPTLAGLLKDSDAATVAAAAQALGEIADAPALAALQAIPEPSAASIATAKLSATRRLPAADALALLNDLQRNARDTVHRTGAFRLTLDLDPAGAAAKIADVLGDTNWPLKEVALESLTFSRAPNLVSTLTGKLATWDAATQQAVIAALERRGEAAAVSALVTATTHADVRAAAITALGALPGTRDTAALLVKLAAGDTTEAKLARQSLARLNGPDVSAFILAGAERGEPETRAIYLEQFALRNLTEGLPLLLKLRIDPSPVVRAAAVGALGDLAPASEQKAVLDWAIEAKDATEQTRALRALVNVTLRNPDAAQRGRPVYALIEFAQPDLALRLLPALARIGGAASADCAAKLAVRDDARVAEAATSALVRWPDAIALPALATVAEKAALQASRASALEAALRQFDRTREPWTPETTRVVARLLAGVQDPDTRKKLLLLLHRANESSALTLAESLKADAALAAEVSIALDVIRANLAGPATARASNPANIANLIDGKTSNRWTAQLFGEEWFEIDYRVSRPIGRVTLDQTGRGAEFPENYEVYVTDDPKEPGKVLASGRGQSNKTVIDLPAGTRGRYLVVKNTAPRNEPQWAVCEVFVD